MRCAFAITVNVIVVAAMLGRTVASTAWTRDHRRAPQEVRFEGRGTGAHGKGSPVWKPRPGAVIVARGMSGTAPRWREWRASFISTRRTTLRVSPGLAGDGEPRGPSGTITSELDADGAGVSGVDIALEDDKSTFQVLREPIQGAGEWTEGSPDHLADEIIVRVHLTVHGVGTDARVPDLQIQLAQGMEGLVANPADGSEHEKRDHVVLAVQHPERAIECGHRVEQDPRGRNDAGGKVDALGDDARDRASHAIATGNEH